MNTIFQIVYSLLKWIADATGFTYNEVNIIAYYIVLPFVYVILADRILKRHLLKILYVTGVALCLLLIDDFTRFSDWLFQKSVQFLLSPVSGLELRRLIRPDLRCLPGDCILRDVSFCLPAVH